MFLDLFIKIQAMTKTVVVMKPQALIQNFHFLNRRSNNFQPNRKSSKLLEKERQDHSSFIKLSFDSLAWSWRIISKYYSFPRHNEVLFGVIYRRNWALGAQLEWSTQGYLTNNHLLSADSIRANSRLQYFAFIDLLCTTLLKVDGKINSEFPSSLFMKLLIIFEGSAILKSWMTVP